MRRGGCVRVYAEPHLQQPSRDRDPEPSTHVDFTVRCDRDAVSNRRGDTYPGK
ncbi:hypothetical protein [Herbiconiux sp.]|uniref:hypothetical protein n=1 Tax=Herbiconiux sp. TaxID=1871186 RepID=UPI0025C64353|nr:hypothetical protein [Herbiconiux sp.]